MKLNEELRAVHPDDPVAICTIITPGKQQDGYWTTVDLIAQIKNKAMPISKILIQKLMRYLCLTTRRTIDIYHGMH